jgi:hypothetical protein
MRCRSDLSSRGTRRRETRLPHDPRSVLERRTTSAGGTAGRLNTHGDAVPFQDDCNDLFDRQIVGIEDCLGCACLQRSGFPL